MKIIGETKKEWGTAYTYAFFEPCLWFWRTALWDQDQGTVIEEKRERDPGAEWTTWIVIAADFYYLTGVPWKQNIGTNEKIL